MVRVHNVTKWARLPKGEELEIVGDALRRVRLEVNSPERAKAYLVREDAPPVFLAVSEGLGVIEFSTPAEKVRVQFVSDEPVWYYTAEGDQIAVARPESPSFVRVASRRERNHELEQMMFKMEQNMNRRIALQFEDLERARAQLEAYRASQAVAAGADEETGEVSDEPERDRSTDVAEGGGVGGDAGEQSAESQGEARKAGKRRGAGVPA